MLLQVLEQLDLLVVPISPFRPPYLQVRACVHKAFGFASMRHPNFISAILLVISTTLLLILVYIPSARLQDVILYFPGIKLA